MPNSAGSHTMNMQSFVQ